MGISRDVSDVKIWGSSFGRLAVASANMEVAPRAGDLGKC